MINFNQSIGEYRTMDFGKVLSVIVYTTFLVMTSIFFTEHPN